MFYANCNYYLLGREHICCPRTGPLTIFNRPDHVGNQRRKFTILNHTTDLSIIYDRLCSSSKNKPKHLLLIVDRGPDNTWKGSLTNIIHYGELWKSLGYFFSLFFLKIFKSNFFPIRFNLPGLLLMTVTGYHPNDSAFNPVERAFSHSSVQITGLTLSDLNENGKKVCSVNATFLSPTFKKPHSLDNDQKCFSRNQQTP